MGFEKANEQYEDNGSDNVSAATRQQTIVKTNADLSPRRVHMRHQASTSYLSYVVMQLTTCAGKC